MNRNKSILILLVLGWPCAAFNEISGFIILPQTMVVYALVLSAIALYLNYRWVHVAPLVLLVTLVLASGGVTTVHTDFVGPAAIKEQGQSYVFFAYAEFLVVLFANSIGIYTGLKRNKRLRGHLSRQDGS